MKVKGKQLTYQGWKPYIHTVVGGIKCNSLTHKMSKTTVPAITVARKPCKQ